MPLAALPARKTFNPLQVWKSLSHPKDASVRLRDRYGELAPINVMGTKYTVVLSPEAALEVFSQPPENYVAFFHESFAGMNGEGSLWILAGEAHRQERKLFAPAVHPSHFRVYGDVIRDIARLHFGRWRVGGTFKSVESTKAIALDVIMRLVFGVEDEQMMREGSIVLDRLTSSVHPFVVFYPKLQRTWLFRRYRKAKAEMYEWAGRLIALRRSRGALGDDVLGRLMRASDEHGRPYTELHICNELLSILTAGHVTTGVALAWALYEVGRHPEVLERLRAELIEAGPEAESHVVATLPYLTAVCNETIRLHPILAECARVPIEPVRIRGFEIPAGEPLVISIVGIHHDARIFPEPGRFLPDRFIERSYSKTEFMPFGGGHRRCLGAGLAEYTMRISLAEAVMSWTFEIARVDRDIRHDLAMGPKFGVPLRILDRYRAPSSARSAERDDVPSQNSFAAAK